MNLVNRKYHRSLLMFLLHVISFSLHSKLRMSKGGRKKDPIPHSRWLNIINYDNSIESFYLSIVMNLCKDEIMKKYSPNSGVTWAKYCREYLYSHFNLPKSCIDELNGVQDIKYFG